MAGMNASTSGGAQGERDLVNTNNSTRAAQRVGINLIRASARMEKHVAYLVDYALRGRSWPTVNVCGMR